MPRSTVAHHVVVLSLALCGVAASAAQSGADTRAQTLIDTNSLLSGYDIRVIADDGRLRLQGVVADPSERVLAEALTAEVADGADVVNELSLEGTLPDAPGSLYLAERDLTTAARLRQTLRWQKDTAGLDIEVEVNRGAVRLNGDVGTTSTKDRVAGLAATTEGVDEVFNYISVDPGRIPAIRERQAELDTAERPDAWIASRLRRLLQFDTTVNARRIEVEAREGAVILSGTVTSSTERKVAEDLAANMQGVRKIDSRLIIDSPR
jgi:osmotically-inducible protein OsmY